MGDKVHEYDCKFIIQLSHSGRQRDVPGVENMFNKSLSSTDNQDTFHGLLCEAATGAQIKELVGWFAQGMEITGFVRNWLVGLSKWHTLFVYEHNAICKRLRLKYPHWDDGRLLNVARLINAAVMAKIHTVEWTPAILPHAAANLALHANWFGLATNALRRGKHRKTLSQLTIRNPEIGGVVGNPRDDHGIPFSLTEEFVEVYRLHSLLP